MQTPHEAPGNVFFRQTPVCQGLPFGDPGFTQYTHFYDWVQGFPGGRDANSCIPLALVCDGRGQCRISELLTFVSENVTQNLRISDTERPRRFCAGCVGRFGYGGQSCHADVTLKPNAASPNNTGFRSVKLWQHPGSRQFSRGTVTEPEKTTFLPFRSTTLRGHL